MAHKTASAKANEAFKLSIFDIRIKNWPYIFIRLNNTPFQSTCFGLIQSDSEMTHVVINNCYLICKNNVHIVC